VRISRATPFLVLILAAAGCKSDLAGAGGHGKDGSAHHDALNLGTDAESDAGTDDTGLPDTGPACGLVTCQSAHASCGKIGDGCGGVIDCGECTAPQTCGGGGTLSTCGGDNGCHPRTCADLTANCGYASDGCGGLLNCGMCNAPDVCGAAGANHCGVPTNDGGPICLPATCASLGISCGMAGDGCGNPLDCGGCTPPQTCGGGGMPSMCGGNSGCVPRTCASVGANCGPIADGCGHLLDCGSCTMGQACGAGGVPNHCATSPDAGLTCVPRTCASVGANCGPMGDGCGGTLNCGGCTTPDSCGGGGTPSVCGNNGTHCTRRTCAQAGANCGPVADGCGGVLSCGTCASPQICGGGGIPSVCGGGGPPPCTNLCLRQVNCPGGGTTSVSGTVVAPTPAQYGNPDPLYNALVYVPNSTVAAFTPGVSCDRCGVPASGSPLTSTVTRYDGTFTIRNMPVGRNVPLVIQLGRWRRQVVIPNVAQCANTALPTTLTRLPRNHTEGDIPLMAMVTGNVDTLECVLRKIGIDDTEFSVPAAEGGRGRVQMYINNGANASTGNAPPESELETDPARLAQYDMVLFACEGFHADRAATDQRNVVDYTTLGGRVFATHFSYNWLYNDAPFSTTGTWDIQQHGQATGDPDLTASIDQSFPKGVAFARWLRVIGSQAPLGEITIDIWRHDLDAVTPLIAQRWIHFDTLPTSPPTCTQNCTRSPIAIEHYTFNTPIGAPSDQQCGRVVYSDFHVNDIMSSMGMNYPAECTPGPMTVQEKALEFMIFDAASCIQPDNPPPPTCTPRSCLQAGANCGPIGDGCGAQIQCGMCTAPQTCGGAGTPSVCGGMACQPRSCAQQGFNCGPAGDGCGGPLSCGTCMAPQTCGGGGTPGVCGFRGVDAGACVPETCASQNISCGPAGDGCGGSLSCGVCTPPDTCGGGGMPGVCGHSSCTPRTCAQAGANCGPVADGCGGVNQCGTCTPPQTCGGGGTPSVCGGACIPLTCMDQHIGCGMAGDGCGGIIDCGGCPPPETCGGGGVPNQCGGNNMCMPVTCQSVGAQCGFIGDGCGNVVDCGQCPTGESCGYNGVPNVCGTRA
jgi:hypothetical protein